MNYHVGKDGQTEGPLTKEDVQQRLADGRLGPDDLVWQEGWSEWIPLEKSSFMESPTGPVDPFEAHPWRRYLARMVDINLFSITLGFGVGLSFPELIDRIPDLVFGVLCLMVMAPLEAVLLSYWGTTPGKSLLGMRLTDIDGQKLKSSACFRRAWGVLVSGCGLGIPLVSLLTMISGYQTLGKSERVSWDRSAGSYVRFRHIGRGRIVLACLLWSGGIFFAILDRLM